MKIIIVGVYDYARDFKPEGIFIVPHLLWHWGSGFSLSYLEGPPPFNTYQYYNQ